jgi:hypothetical protein
MLTPPKPPGEAEAHLSLLLGVAAAWNQNVTPGGGKPGPLPLSPRLQSIIVAAHAPPRHDARWHQLMKSLCYDPEAQFERE